MDVKIIEEKENPLFNRKEIKLEIETELTPNYADTEKLIAEKYSTDLENIKINNIKGKFGVHKFFITANVYNSKKDKDNFEIKTKKQRDAEKKARLEEEKKLAEEKKKAKEEAEAAKIEATKPAEETKEESKFEEKTE